VIGVAHEQWYEHAHNKPMGLKAIARMIQTMLYAKRFFPYYVYNILGGIEEDGKLPNSPQ
jgi:20S proteasome subunit beta 6